MIMLSLPVNRALILCHLTYRHFNVLSLVAMSSTEMWLAPAFVGVIVIKLFFGGKLDIA